MKIAIIDHHLIDKLQELIGSHSFSDDSYLACAFYYLSTARKGGWYIEDGQRLLLIARHPHRSDELIMFPEMSPAREPRFKLTRDVLTSDTFDRFRVSLGRFTPQLLNEFRAEFGDLITAREFVDREMDWAYPLRVLSTCIVSRINGVAFAKVRNKIRRSFKSVSKIVPIEHKMDAVLNEVFSLWNVRMQAVAPSSYVEAGEYYHAFAKAISASPESIRGMVALDYSNEPVGITLWRNVSPTVANLYVNISDPNIVGLSDALLVEACRAAKASGIDLVNLGGSEIESLDKFKLKYQPVQSVYLNSCALAPIRSYQAQRENWLDSLIQ